MKLKVQKSSYLRFVQKARKVLYVPTNHVSVTDGTTTAHATTETLARNMYHTYVHAMPVTDLKSKGYMQ